MFYWIEPSLTIYLFTYLFAISVLTFFLYAGDKHRAIYDKRRIPESLLLGLAIAGGAWGAGWAMLLFRHKTRHVAFLIIVPIFILLWLAGVVLLKLGYLF